MSTLAVGTTNPGKVQAVRATLASYEKMAPYVLLATKVESGVSNQPMSLSETSIGAETRARRARDYAAKSNPNSQIFGVGLESGLFEGPGGKLYDVCACCIFDGEHAHLGYSSAWALPDAVAAKIRCDGLDMTQAANAAGLCNDPNIGDKGGLIGVLTGGRITRPDYTIQSIQMALLTMDPALYACSPTVPQGINSPPKPKAPSFLVNFLKLAVVAGAAAMLTLAATKRKSSQ